MSVLSGFKEFISRGSAVDMAVGVVVGGAFTAIVNAVVDNLVNPLIAALFKGPALSAMAIWHVGGSAIKFGAVADAIIKFLIIAAALYFFIIVPLNRLSSAFSRKKEEEEEPEPGAEEKLLAEIRDLLKEDSSRNWPYAGGS